MCIIYNMAANADLAKLTGEIARRICVRLSENGNKTSWLYRGIGRDRFWWARIMIGKSNFTIPDLLAIAKLLGVTSNLVDKALMLVVDAKSDIPDEDSITTLTNLINEMQNQINWNKF
jgi:hypothetical protein